MTDYKSKAPKQPVASIGGRAASGVLWLTVQKWAIRISGLVTIAVLTRVLGPQDFGTVAAASTVLPFFYLLSDVGFAAYIVQVDRTDRRMLSTSFWFSVLAGLVLAALLVAAAPLFGLVFKSDDFVPVLQVLSLTVLLTAASSVPMALLRRSMRFRALAVQGTIAALVAQAVAVAMTLTGFGVWALVGQAVASQVIMAVLAWSAARWLPTFIFSRRDFSTMARFGSKVLGVEFVAMGRAWAEAAIISSTLGMAPLGYLNIAQRLVQIVQDLTGAALVPVSTVAFARIRDSSDRLRGAYIRALRMTYAALSPLLLLLAVAASLIIPIVFGDGWEQSAHVTQILALAGLMVVGATLDHGLFYGLGKPGRWFIYALIIDVCTVAATAITAPWGLEAVAYGFLAVAVVATVSRWFLVAILLHATPRALAGPFGFLVTAVLAGGGAGWAVFALSAELPSLVRITLIGLAVLVAYLAVVCLLARQVIDDVVNYIPRFGKGDPPPHSLNAERSLMNRPTSSPHVLIIVQNLPVPLDRRVWLECQALIARGYRVSVICPKGPGDPAYQRISGVDIYKYKPAREAKSTLGFVWEFAYSWLRTAWLSLTVHHSRPFDIIQACNPPDTYWLLALLWRPFRVKFVFDHHDLNPELFISRFGEPRGGLKSLAYSGLLRLERATFRTAHRVISTNESYKAVAVLRGRRLPDEVMVVRSGPDTRRMRPIYPDRARPANEINLVYLGIMGPQDGVDHVLLVVDELVHRRGRENVTATLLGFGDCFEDLRVQAAALGLDDHVTFTGRVDQVAIAEHLSRADIGLCPDLKTPLNDMSTMNKTMEYMSYGLPAVSFDLVETRVSGGDTVLYVPSGDIRAFADAVESLINAPALRAELGRKARTRVATLMDWRPQSEAYVSVFDDLSGPSQPAPIVSPINDAASADADTEGRRYVNLDDTEEFDRYLMERNSSRAEPAMMPARTNVHHLLSQAAAATPDAPALTYRNATISYAETWRMSRAAASWLLAAGLQRGDRVAIYLEKRFETVASIFAVSAAGGIFVPINHVLKAAQVGHILGDSRATVLITSADRLSLLASVLPDTHIEHVIVVGDAVPDPAASWQVHSWDDGQAVVGDPRRSLAIDIDPAAILYTSGSTGKPKGVVLSHRNLIVGAESVSTYLENTSDDVILSVLPLSFDAGLSQVTTAFSVGAHCVLMNYLLPQDVPKLCEQYGVTGLTCVPPLWLQLADLSWPEPATRRMRYWANTGGRMPRPTLDRLREIFTDASPYLMYGLTEAFRSTYLDPSEVDRRPHSIGKAIPNAEILVLRPDGTPCEPGEEGELVHRGALVALGYWDDPIQTAERYRPVHHSLQQWRAPEMAVWSGDRVVADQEGFLYFVGRTDHMIKTSGYRVSPDEIEEAAYSTGLVRDAVALGEDDALLGQRIVLVVTPMTTEFDINALAAALRQMLPRYMVPSRIDVRDELPRSANGKYDRNLLISDVSG